MYVKCHEVPKDCKYQSQDDNKNQEDSEDQNIGGKKKGLACVLFIGVCMHDAKKTYGYIPHALIFQGVGFGLLLMNVEEIV